MNNNYAAGFAAAGGAGAGAPGTAGFAFGSTGANSTTGKYFPLILQETVPGLVLLVANTEPVIAGKPAGRADAVAV